MNDEPPRDPIDPDALAVCLRVLRAVVEAPAQAAAGEELERLAARIYKRARKQRRRIGASERQAEDRAVLEQVLTAREQGVAFEESDEEDLEDEASDVVRLRAGSRRCYVCRSRYRDLHVRYHLLCPECAAIHEQKRAERLDLSGRRALVTGARVSIGHATALRLLRDGAEVIATSRFPEAAARAFERAPGSEAMRDRLHVLGADFRDPREAERLAERVSARFGSIDILVNNAARTVDRAEDEQLAAGEVDASVEDLREANAWTMRLGDVTAEELLEVLHVNAAAPFLLTARLLPALRSARAGDRYVVNVVGLDGQLDRKFKRPIHPHVNASKAALNMLTRTSAPELAADGIFMNSVDVGWVTHEGGSSTRRRAREAGFLPPLDAEDAAARICDPIARGLAGAPVFGRMWKDFREAGW